MLKNHAFEEICSTCTLELMLSNYWKFLRSERNVVQLKMEHDVRQPVVDKLFYINP